MTINGFFSFEHVQSEKELSIILRLHTFLSSEENHIVGNIEMIHC